MCFIFVKYEHEQQCLRCDMEMYFNQNIFHLDKMNIHNRFFFKCETLPRKNRVFVFIQSFNIVSLSHMFRSIKNQQTAN